jgi:hypothetical protein
VVRFDSSDDNLVLSDYGVTASDFTIFLVYRCATLANYNGIIGDANDRTPFVFHAQNDGTCYFDVNTTTGRCQTAGGFLANNTWAILCLQHGLTTASQVSLNGGIFTSGSNNDALSGTGINLGAAAGFSTGANADFAHVAIYDGIKSGAAITAIVANLQTIYGL